MLNWVKVEDGEYNEHTTEYKGHKVSVFSDRDECEWSYMVDDEELYSLDPDEVADLDDAKKEVEIELKLTYGK